MVAHVIIQLVLLAIVTVYVSEEFTIVGSCVQAERQYNKCTFEIQLGLPGSCQDGVTDLADNKWKTKNQI